MRQALQDIGYHEVAATLIFLTGKMGSASDYKKIENVIKYCASDAKKDGKLVDLDENSKVFLSNVGI